MSAHDRHEAVAGPIWTPFFKVVALIVGITVVLMARRFTLGLGSSTALSDGYPWGLWIAFDVVTGTALGCGGYAMALLVYIFNRGKYHPMVRPALLTSALGYTTAAVAIHLDVGRPLYLYKIPVSPMWWNLNSALLEVAVCVMTYIVVLWLEISPAFFEKWERGPDGFFKKLANTFHPIIDKIMVPLMALGLLLPTMHQSSLGALMLLGGKKVHGLWHTPLLPGLYLLSCVGMGYAVVAFESILSSRTYKRPRETRMLASLAGVTGWVVLIFSGIRLVDIVLRGKAALIFQPTIQSLFFLVEMAAFVVGGLMLVMPAFRNTAAGQFQSAMLVIFAGTLYRIDTYLVAYNPGPNWHYFPSVPEMLITVGVIGLEILAYVVIVKTFPILRGATPAQAAS
jgi:Ni/Fe-hydrogenase subunit HybB-like protein